MAIASSTLYTKVRQRGTTRQLVQTSVVCAIAALLMLPAIIWFQVRFLHHQGTLSSLEIIAILCYVAVCGWLLPILIASGHCLLAQPHNSHPKTTHHLPSESQKKAVQTTEELYPPRYQPGVLAPFVFGEDTPWGWLEYRSGNFQGQRLALKRTIATLGRDEECDIWLDDDMASRFHAELAWYEGRVCLTDCGSMNGLLLNGQRVFGTTLISSQQSLEIGSQRFLFILAELKEALRDQYDPLTNHTWRSSSDLQADQPDTSSAMPTARILMTDTFDAIPLPTGQKPPADSGAVKPSNPTTPPPFTNSLRGPMPLKLPSRQKEHL